MKGKICILTTISLSIKNFYRGQLSALRDAGFEVVVVCADDIGLQDQLPHGIRFIPIQFTRSINPILDILILGRLFHLFRLERFDIVQYSTPKASLLAAVAAWLANVPVRIYLLWGLYYVGQNGFRRWLFKCFEKLICRLSHKIMPISHEMVNFALNEGLGRCEQYEVILNGSACGVDLEAFDPAKWVSYRKIIRDQYNLPENAIVIGTVSRLTHDKGINELLQAFDRLCNEIPRVYLLLVGTQENKDKLSSESELLMRNSPRIRQVGWQDNPLPFYAAMDIFVLPTYREGFGEVNLEAQAMELPVISTNIIGPREAIEDGVTGFLVPPKSISGLYEAMRRLATDQQLRQRMGKKGRERVIYKFDRRAIIAATVQHRLSLLKRS